MSSEESQTNMLFTLCNPGIRLSTFPLGKNTHFTIERGDCLIISFYGKRQPKKDPYEERKKKKNEIFFTFIFLDVPVVCRSSRTRD